MVDIPKPSLKVLLVEDDAIDRLAFTRLIARSNLPYDYTIASSLIEAQSLLESQSFDVAIVDFYLGDGNAFELVEQIQSKNLPFIVATGSGDEQVAVQMLRQGAYDYLIKDPDRHYLSILPIAVERALARRQSEDKIHLLSYALQNVQDGIYMTNEQGHLIFVNNALAQICNCRAEEVIGQPIQALGQPDLTELFESEDVQIKSSYVLQTEIAIQVSTLVSFPALLSESRIKRQGTTLRFGVIRDITELKKIQLDLQKARDGLEQQVEQRTAQLEQTNQALLEEVIERKQVEVILQNLIEGTAATTGKDFFPALVEYMAQGLNVSYAFVNQVVDNKLSSLGFWADDALQPTFSCNLEHTPCERTFLDGRFYCQDSIQEQFPNNSNLVKLGAESYLGLALYNNQGKTIGTLCIIDRQPLLDPQRVENLLRVFAARAAAEIERQRATNRLEQLNQELEAKFQERTAALQEREEHLRELSARLNLAVESAAIGIWDWDIIQNILVWDKRMYQLYGMNQDDFTNVYEAWSSRLHPEDRVETETAVRQALEGKTDYNTEFRVIHPDGSIHFIKANALVQRNAQSEPQRMVGINYDITERKQAEWSLREAEAKYRAIYDNSVEGMYQSTPEGYYLMVNMALARMYGYQSPEQMISELNNIREQLYVDPQRRDEFERLIATQISICEFESEVYRRDGTTLWIAETGRLVRNEQKHFSYYEGIVSNITERKQAEIQLQQTNNELARATRLKDEFLANMSHELRTPLNAILGMTEGLQDRVFGNLNPKQLDAIKTIDRSGSHLLELINDILDVAKIESGQLELDLNPISITSLCQSSLAFIKQQALKKRIQLEVNLPGNLPDLLLDARRMRQVLINLLNNAVKFTPERGRITLEVCSQPPQAPQNFLQIAITDTGIGIAPENLEKLFQPFIQIDSALNRQYQGTGLGLVLVKQIVELHGGKVRVTSEMGKGSCFILEIPCTMPTCFSPEPTSALEPEMKLCQRQSDTSPLILLAEDNEANISTISTYLTAKNYRLLLATNGQEAVELANSQQPDVILMDIQMPIVDGLEAIQLIRQKPQLVEVPIIVLTSLAMKGDRDRCLAAGATDYLSKPVKLKQLVTTIQQFVAS